MSLVSKKDVAVGPGVFVATAGASITKGDVLSYDVSKSGDERYFTVVPADTDSSPPQIAPAGVALADAASGAEVVVQFWGFCAVVNVASTVDAGETLALSTTAGRAAAFELSASGNAQTLTVPASGVIGVAASTASANKSSAWISIPRHQ